MSTNSITTKSEPATSWPEAIPIDWNAVPDSAAEWRLQLNLQRRGLIEHQPPANDAEARPAEGWIVTPASEIEPCAIDWLWPGWIPLGGTTTIQGQMGDGKGTASVDLIARCTRGDCMPDGTTSHVSGPINVAVLVAEDSHRAVLVPRLVAAGADIDRVFIVVGDRAADGSKRGIADVTLGAVNKLSRVVDQLAIKLVVADPFTAFTGGKDINRSKDVREMFTPLNEFAEDRNIAIVLIRHLRKETASAISAGAGSIDISANSRSVIVFGRPPAECGPDEQETIQSPQERVWGHVKSNYSASMKTQRCKIVPVVMTLPTRSGGTREVELTKIQWLGECDLNADDITRRSQGDPDQNQGRRPGKQRQAENRILELLNTTDGGYERSEVIKSALVAELECGERTAKRALSALLKAGKVWTARSASAQPHTIWCLDCAVLPAGYQSSGDGQSGQNP